MHRIGTNFAQVARRTTISFEVRNSPNARLPSFLTAIITISQGKRFSMVARPTREQIVHTLRTCQAVCFDVDSTIIPEEGIDELAAFKGVGEEVSAWTRQYVLLTHSKVILCHRCLTF
jgi:hypothetical protein